jgi:5-methylcytosine-specific restriction endonuclease McrA
MPYMKNGKRDFKTEYAEYHSSDEQKKNRAKRNTARRQMESAGKVSKGDGKDVDHVKPLSKGGSTAKSNLKVKTKSANRSFARNKDSSVK